MNPFVKNMIRVGRVSSVYPERSTARVTFEDQTNVVSHELDVIGRGSLLTKDYWLPVPGEQVLCLFLPNGNAQGFILGSCFNKEDKPPVRDAGKRHLRFADGAWIEYDQKTHTLTIDLEKPDGIVVLNGRLIVNEPHKGGA
ncbi:phage baseplate assembly protein V [Brevibacillus ruminantium]|uniref:Phage baseplate assembly protein V n=1 Tax=Brevibacillus ruminantium TaxID=2950604 RepID=A0ABY4WJW9_9BACL|nr:phage baseplate assembly protein V [Brevibacillus ruminantium]USG67453.1 phage baseplate assembly protein V [Brevibacillus ruminantium]